VAKGCGSGRFEDHQKKDKVKAGDFLQYLLLAEDGMHPRKEVF
jgi:hypothetical protein